MAPNSERMQQAIRAVDDLRDEIVRFLQVLVQAPSENPTGDTKTAAKVMAQQLEAWGISSSLVQTPEAKVEKRGLSGERWNVIGTLPGSEGTGNGLGFNAHLDTVPIGDVAKWTHPPFSGALFSNKVWGRGACDSKGRLAAYGAAMAAIHRAGIRLKQEVVLTATADEEIGGELGAGYIMSQGLAKSRWVVIEGSSDRITRAVSGLIWLEITVHGRPAHTARKWNGVNAIEQAAKVVRVLQDMQEEFEQRPSQLPGIRCTVVNIGTISGGTQPNVVPDRCVIQVDFRVAPETTLQEVMDNLYSRLQDLKQADSEFAVDVRVLPDSFIEPTITAEDDPIVAALQEAILEETGCQLPVVATLGQSDARWFQAQGITTIQYGPGTADCNVHSYDENMDVDDLIKTVKCLVRLIMKLCA